MSGDGKQGPCDQNCLCNPLWLFHGDYLYVERIYTLGRGGSGKEWPDDH